MLEDNKALIFGREPAVIVGFLQAVIVLASATVLGWSTEQVGAVSLVVVGVGDLYVALFTRATLLGVSVGLLKAAVAAFAAFGYQLSPETFAALQALVTAGLALFQRTQTSPTSRASLDLAA